MRQIIISAIGLLLIGAALFANKKMLENAKKEEPVEVRRIPVVFVETAQNGTTPITVKASGNLAARDRIEIFSEVQGIFEYSDHRFEPGIRYANGATLMRINSDEHRATMRAQKSSLFNQIVAALPDLRFDFPDAYQKWEAYVNAFSVEKTLAPLPQPDTDKERLFIAGRNINSLWYNVKNLEERLAKYTIYAPFSGVLTSALVDKGALIRPGQKLGEFISPNAYEVEVAVNSEYAKLLKVGNRVKLQNVEGNQTWNGIVSRLNSLINPATQTLQAFIQVSGKDLREGMYLEANLSAANEANTLEIDRKLLVDNEKIFFLKDTILELMTIAPIYFNDKTVVIRGVENGTKLLSKPLPGAYQGMRVNEFK